VLVVGLVSQPCHRSEILIVCSSLDNNENAVVIEFIDAAT